MGMFDSFHGGGICAQVKCLGKSLANYIPGDSVVLYQRPLEERAQDYHLAGDVGDQPPAELVDGEPSHLQSFQIALKDSDGLVCGFIQVRQGRLADWTPEEDGSVLALDNRGRPFSGRVVLAGVGTPPQDCPYCDAVRSGVNGRDFPIESRKPASVTFEWLDLVDPDKRY
jgi:hypothetical protein